MHTLACLYFYQRRNLRYAVATRRQPQAWTSAPAAGEYARMEYKSVLRFRDIQLRAILQEISLSLIITTVWKITYLRFRLNLPEANMLISCYMTSLRGRCRLKSLASRLFCPPFIQAQLNGYTKAPRHSLCERNLPVAGGFPSQRSLTRKAFPFDDVIMYDGLRYDYTQLYLHLRRHTWMSHFFRSFASILHWRLRASLWKLRTRYTT